MDQTWLTRFDAKRRDYSRRRDVAYPPEDGDSAHSNLLFDLTGDDLSIGDAGLVIGKDSVRGETIW